METKIKKACVCTYRFVVGSDLHFRLQELVVPDLHLAVVEHCGKAVFSRKKTNASTTKAAAAKRGYNVTTHTQGEEGKSAAAQQTQHERTTRH